MEFDQLLHAGEYSSQKEVVGLAIYFLEEFEGQQEIGHDDVDETIRPSRESVARKHISTYLRRLESDGYLTTGTDGYRLTHDGRKHLRGLLPKDLVSNPREARFIDSDLADSAFYEQLVEDINTCYEVRVNDAVLVLTRKLFENLLVDILRGHYGRQNIDYFFDADRGYHHGLSTLKSNLRDNVADFRIYSRDIDEDLLDRLDGFKEQGDAGAHSIVVSISDDELEEMSHEATELFELFYDLWQEVRLANN